MRELINLKYIKRIKKKRFFVAELQKQKLLVRSTFQAYWASTSGIFVASLSR